MAVLSLAVREKVFEAVGEAPPKRVLSDVAFEVQPGETVGLIGPSGCGKTTILNIVAGLQSLDRGQLAISPGARLAYVFQEPRLLPWLSVAANLRLVIEGEADADARVEHALGEVGLADAGGVYASRLSLGMARRVSLARGFLVHPDLLLLDEPFVSLDEATAQRLRHLLLDLLEHHRTSAIFVTHRVREAVMIAGRLIVLSASPGRLRFEVPVRLSRSERRSTAAVGAEYRRILQTYDLDPASLEGAIDA